MFFFLRIWTSEATCTFSHGKLWCIFISKKGVGNLDDFFGKNE